MKHVRLFTLTGFCSDWYLIITRLTYNQLGRFDILPRSSGLAIRISGGVSSLLGNNICSLRMQTNFQISCFVWDKNFQMTSNNYLGNNVFLQVARPLCRWRNCACRCYLSWVATFISTEDGNATHLHLSQTGTTKRWLHCSCKNSYTI